MRAISVCYALGIRDWASKRNKVLNVTEYRLSGCGYNIIISAICQNTHGPKSCTDSRITTDNNYKKLIYWYNLMAKI